MTLMSSIGKPFIKWKFTHKWGPSNGILVHCSQKVWLVIAFIVINIENICQKIIIMLNNLQNVMNQIKKIIFKT